MAQRQPGHYLVNRYTRKVIAGPDSPVVLNATLRRKAAKLSRGVKCPLAVVKWDGGKAVAASNVAVSAAVRIENELNDLKYNAQDIVDVIDRIAADAEKPNSSFLDRDVIIKNAKAAKWAVGSLHTKLTAILKELPKALAKGSGGLPTAQELVRQAQVTLDAAKSTPAIKAFLSRASGWFTRIQEILDALKTSFKSDPRWKPWPIFGLQASTPEKAEELATEMRDKYGSDVQVGWPGKQRVVKVVYNPEVVKTQELLSVAQTVDEDVRAMKAPTPDTTSMSHSVSASTSKWYVVSNEDSAKFADMCAEDGAGTSLWKKGSTNSVVRVLAEPDQLGSVQRAIRQFKAREFTGSQSLSLKHSVSASIPRPSMGDRLLLKNGKKVVVVLNTAWPMKLQVVDISQPLSGARRPFDVSPDEVSKIVDTGAIRTPLDDGSSGEAESTPRMRGKMLKPGAKDKRFKASNVSAARNAGGIDVDNITPKMVAWLYTDNPADGVVGDPAKLKEALQVLKSRGGQGFLDWLKADSGSGMVSAFNRHWGWKKASNVSASFRVINGQHEDIVKGAIANMGLDHLIRPGATARDMYDSAWGALAESVGENKAEKMLQEEIRDAAKRRGVKLSHVISADSSLRYVFPSAKHAAKFVEQIQALSPDLKTGSQGTAGVVLNPGLYAADIADTARKLGGKPPAALSAALNSTNTQIRNLFLRKGAGAFWSVRYEDMSKDDIIKDLEQQNKPYLDRVIQALKSYEMSSVAAGPDTLSFKRNRLSSVRASDTIAVAEAFLKAAKEADADMKAARLLMKGSDARTFTPGAGPYHAEAMLQALKQGQVDKAKKFASLGETYYKGDAATLPQYAQSAKPKVKDTFMVAAASARFALKAAQAAVTAMSSISASSKGTIQRTAKGYTYQVKGEPRSITIKSPEEMSSILKALGVSMSPAQLVALPQGRDWPFSNVSAASKTREQIKQEGYALMKKVNKAEPRGRAQVGYVLTEKERQKQAKLQAEVQKFEEENDCILDFGGGSVVFNMSNVAASSPVEIVMKQSDLAVMKRKYPALKIISTRTRGNDLYPLEIAVKVQGDDADDAEEEFSSQLAEERSVGKRSLSNVSAAIPAQYERAIKQLLGKHVPNGEIEATINDVKSGIDKPLAAAQALLRDTPLSGDRDVLTRVADALERLSGNNALSAVSATNPLLLDAVSRKAR